MPVTASRQWNSAWSRRDSVTGRRPSPLPRILHKLKKSLHGAFGEHGIGIEQQCMSTFHLSERQVIGGGESEITGVLNHLDLWELFLHRRHAAVGGSIVHQPYFIAEVVDGFVYGGLHFNRSSSGVPIDDHHGKVHVPLRNGRSLFLRIFPVTTWIKKGFR